MNGEPRMAPAAERTMDAGEYLLGCLVLAAILVPVGWAAWRARRALLPGWSGAPARLAELVLATAGLLWLSELAGSFGGFSEAPMIAGSVALAALATALGARIERGRRAEPPAARPPDRGAGPVATALAVAALAGLAAAWAIPTLGSLAGGMDRADSLWYHMPLSARFVQTAELGGQHFLDPIFFATYYPANSEVVHAVPILAFGRDFLSPLINLGFLAIALLACWCIGRPFGLAPQATIGGSIALGSQMLVEFQAGEALNDITGVAYVLAGAAVLANGHLGSRPAALPLPPGAPEGRGALPAPRDPRRAGAGALAVAGIAAGIAAGTKLSFVVPAAALAVAAVAIARPGRRVGAALAVGIPMALAAGYWYARNLVLVGNPLPYVQALGLPGPERGFELRPGFSVSHYWNDPGVWSEWFVPALDASFGALWPLTLIAFAAAGAWTVARGGEPVRRALGAVVLVTALAYLFTPLTAAGQEGEPISFEWNVRYLAPAAALGLALLPCLRPLRRSAGRRAATLAALAALLAVTLASLVQWQQGHTKGAVAAGALVLAAGAGLALLRRRGLLGPAGTPAAAAGIAVLVLAGGVAAGYAEQRHYLERRYENTSFRRHLAEAFRWARDLREARIAISGVRGVFNQYPFFGTDLSNEVQWLGVEGSDGAFLRIATCERWREEVDEGDYDYVVTMFDPYWPGPLTDTKEAVWTRRDPATRQVLRDGPVSVFEVTGRLDPRGCEGLPDLSAAELNGDSVNEAPLANQPRLPGSGR